jgi:hypothetical protein
MSYDQNIDLHFKLINKSQMNTSSYLYFLLYKREDEREKEDHCHQGLIMEEHIKTLLFLLIRTLLFHLRSKRTPAWRMENTHLTYFQPG